MSRESAIEWTEATINCVTGCSPVSAGCAHCYAARLAATRLRKNPRYVGLADKEPLGDRYDWTGEVRLHPDLLEQPRHWRKPRRIFVCSTGDLFHPDVPASFIDQVWEMMAACPQHTFIVLTRRPEHIAEKLYGVTTENPARELGGGDYLPNVWLGTTVENQAMADQRIPVLLSIPAAVHFISAEPLLGPINLRQAGPHTNYRLGWCIAGAETGPGARPMQQEWATDLYRQCEAAGVPFFFKRDSAGERALLLPDGTRQMVEQYPEGA